MSQSSLDMPPRGKVVVCDAYMGAETLPTMRQLITVTLTALALTLAFATSAPDVDAKEYGKCGFDSDCHAGVKCSSGHCSDSAGGKCGFDSDCGGAKCRSGKCASAPDGTCAFDSDCGRGGKCRSQKCSW